MLIVDGSNLLHRVLHTALIELRSNTGIVTGGIHGVFQSLHGLVREYKYQKGLVVAWDLGASKFRRAIYPEYKASRSTEIYDPNLRPVTKTILTDEDRKTIYAWSRNLLHRALLPLTGTISVLIPNIEGDDIISWFARKVLLDRKKIIVSSDIDFLQLINDKTEWYDHQRRKHLNKQAFIDEWGLIPEHYQQHYLMAKAMMGDTSDEIKGIDGIGPKWGIKIARTLLTEGEEGLNPNKVRLHARFLENKEIWERNLKLVDLLTPDQNLAADVRAPIELLSRLKIQTDTSTIDVLKEKLREFELIKAIATVDDIVEANENSNIHEALEHAINQQKD